MRKTQKEKMYCNPDVCPHCEYVGDGDSFCDKIFEFVIEGWMPTCFFMSVGCPYRKAVRK